MTPEEALGAYHGHSYAFGGQCDAAIPTRMSAPNSRPKAVTAVTATAVANRFDGMLFHATGEGPDGFFIVDLFESDEAVEAFQEALATVPREVGIDEPPKFFPTHTVFVDPQVIR